MTTNRDSALSQAKDAPVYIYAWGNNERRAQLKGRECVIEARGRMRSVLVRFLDNGERTVTSARALRPKRGRAT